VFLLGASYGDAIALTYAPRLKLDGVISLSGEAYLPSASANPFVSAPHLRIPLLIVGSRHDRYLPVKDALALLRRAGSSDKRTALYSGAGTAGRSSRAPRTRRVRGPWSSAGFAPARSRAVRPSRHNPDVAGIPDTLVLKRHRDLEGRRHQKWVRRGLLVLVGVVPLLALINIFGQRPHVESVSSPAAKLELYSTAHLRGGLLWEARFTVHARRNLKDAVLELDRGWMEGMTINTIEPSPIGEGSHDGKLVLDLGHVPAGQRHVLYVQFQVNPTNVGRRGQAVRLYDGKQLLATLHRRVTVFP
jgi:hypothetical protein